MNQRIALLMLAVIAGAPFAQSAAEYCSVEKAEGESCYRNCCESNGYTWDPSGEGGCAANDEEYQFILAECGPCSDTYLDCVHSYEAGTSGGTSDWSQSSGGSGCCSGFIVLSLLGLAAIVPRN